MEKSKPRAKQAPEAVPAKPAALKKKVTPEAMLAATKTSLQKLPKTYEELAK